MVWKYIHSIQKMLAISGLSMCITAVPSNILAVTFGWLWLKLMSYFVWMQSIICNLLVGFHSFPSSEIDGGYIWFSCQKKSSMLPSRASDATYNVQNKLQSLLKLALLDFALSVFLVTVLKMWILVRGITLWIKFWTWSRRDTTYSSYCFSPTVNAP